MPSNYPGGLHAYREDLVFQRFRSAWTSYSKLRAQSIVARYLSTTQRVFLQKPVEDHYSEQDPQKARVLAGYYLAVPFLTVLLLLLRFDRSNILTECAI